MLRFAANLSMLFAEAPFLERFERAAAAGFRAVEFAWPGDDLVAETVAAARAAAVEVILINFDAGDMAAGDRGLAGDPARERAFRANVPIAVEMAAALGCRRLNALIGRRAAGVELERQWEVAAENLAFAADAAAEIDATVLVENLNPFDSGADILVQRVEQALELVERAGRPNLALQYDVFHAQRAEGNLTATLSRLFPHIGHVQVADAPGRGEPGTGEIDFDFVFAELERLGYGGWVGVEYRPTRGSTEESLGWLRGRL